MIQFSDRIPVDIRRTTLVVRDIEKSLPFYRDALGLQVIYDELIGGKTDRNSRSQSPTIRLVLLRANDQFIGMLGLMQRLNQPPAPLPTFTKARPGQMIIVMNATDLEDRWPRIKVTPHIKVDSPPKPIEYPRSGGGVIPVLFSSVWDADGNYIEINKIMGSPAGSAHTE
jgi:catechol 2,3-dioxygenase-like lactoylglutathione lyase family enzyme